MPNNQGKKVTILILIDGFLQYIKWSSNSYSISSHNPYFNRWFSAIYINEVINMIFGGSQSLF